MLVNLTQLGTKFSGKYKLTTVTHRYGEDGVFKTHFTVEGARHN